MSLRTIFLAVCLEAVVVVALPLTAPRSVDTEDGQDILREDEPFLEGDVVIGSETIPVLELRTHLQRSLVSDPRRLWPGKEVPYEYTQGQFSAQLRAIIEEALQDIMDNSCVRFTPRRNQTTFLKLRETGKGCASKVGYHETSSTVQLGGPKCQTKGTVQHEFLHALGFWHEHTRPDRDNYVSVLWDNVRPDRKKDFVKRGDSEVSNQGLPYDYSSVMHYKHTAFSTPKGMSTLVPKNKEAVAIMGQRRGVSRVDVAKLNRLYNCTGDYYRGDDLEGVATVLGEVLDKRKNKRPKSKADEGFQNICKEDERKGCELESDKMKNINSLMKQPTPPLKAQDFNEEHILSNLEQPTQMRVKKVLIEKVVDSETIRTSEINIIINKTNEIKTILNTVLDESPRTKRQTVDMKQSSKEGEMIGQQPMDGQHETFTPQKILPELLKGVLGNDKDRPIVIQFAIYQPIVYNSPNETESSTGKNSKQTTEKIMTKDTEDRNELRETTEPTIKEDAEQETGQIRSLRDREKYFRENGHYEEADSDGVINYRNGNFDEPQRKGEGGFKPVETSRIYPKEDSGAENLYSGRSKDVNNQHNDGSSTSTRDYIQPLRATHNDDYSPTERYDTFRNSNNKNNRGHSGIDDDAYTHKYVANEEHVSHSDKHSLEFDHGPRVANDYNSNTQESLRFIVKNGPRSDDFNQEYSRPSHDTRTYDRDNTNKDPLRISSEQDHDFRSSYDSHGREEVKRPLQLTRSDYGSHSDRDKYNTNSDDREILRISSKPADDFLSGSENYSKNNNRDSLTTSRPEYNTHDTHDVKGNNAPVYDESRGQFITRKTDPPSWNQNANKDKVEEHVSSGETIPERPTKLNGGRDFDDVSKTREVIGRDRIDGKPKRVRPDLFIEEPSNDDLDKQLRKKKMDKELNKGQAKILDRTVRDDEKQLFIRDKEDTEVHESKQEFVTDNEGLVSKPHSMLNLNPRQALPLNAPSKSSTKRLVRIEKVPGQGEKSSREVSKV